MTTLASGEVPATASRPARIIPKDRNRSALKAQENRAAYLFLTPWLIGIIGITLMPMIASLYLSFTQYGVLGAPTWVGWDN